SLRVFAESVPRGKAIRADLSFSDGRFEKLERFADPAAEFVHGNFAHLRFRVVQVKDVHAFDAEIRQAAVELVGQVARRHAMAAGCDLLRLENSGLDEFARKIFACVVRHYAVGSQETGLRAENDLLARKSVGRKLLERGSD